MEYEELDKIRQNAQDAQIKYNQEKQQVLVKFKEK